MDWPILDFLLNPTTLLGLIAILTVIWTLIISVIGMFWEEIGGRK
ncbi:Uncharacterised protein [Streptococcus suis]|nr:Uncharacterised protein [Streptococcus suis]CYX00951.1 Uncharacterised protein [Streptococcus suis]